MNVAKAVKYCPRCESNRFPRQSQCGRRCLSREKGRRQRESAMTIIADGRLQQRTCPRLQIEALLHRQPQRRLCQRVERLLLLILCQLRQRRRLATAAVKPVVIHDAPVPAEAQGRTGLTT